MQPRTEQGPIIGLAPLPARSAETLAPLKGRVILRHDGNRPFPWRRASGWPARPWGADARAVLTAAELPFRMSVHMVGLFASLSPGTPWHRGATLRTDALWNGGALLQFSAEGPPGGGPCGPPNFLFLAVAGPLPKTAHARLAALAAIPKPAMRGQTPEGVFLLSDLPHLLKAKPLAF